MNDRIYYIDSTCREFSAVVTRSFEHAGRPAVSLNRTAFYPSSGGQPFDSGVLGGAKVIDVVDLDGAVVHVLDAPLAEGSTVDGAIDWTRRFDHMQQHSGQHILSAAFEQVTRSATASFHLGTETSTIDLVREVSAGDVERAELAANSIVWDDHAVSVRFVSAEEVARLPLRKESTRDGTLRLIEIPGFDLSACGGTHVRRTGEVGMIAVTGTERFKGGTRVTFVCGARALRSHRTLRDTISASIQVLSVAPHDLAVAIERLQEELKEHRKTLKEMRVALAIQEANALLEAALLIGGVRVVVRSFEDHDSVALKSMATAMTSAAGVAVALFTSVSPLQVVVARSANVGLDAGAILRQLFAEYGGKGGGKPDCAQGGGLLGDVRQIVWTASGLVEDALTRP